MKKKTIIILIIILVAIVSLVWKFCPCVKEEAGFSWGDHLSEIKAVLKQTNKEGKLAGEQLRAAEISREADLTSDGLSEALILTGTGGAYAEDVALFIVKDGKPALAKFVSENGERGPIIFAEGASVRNGSKVDWQPEKGVIYSGNWSVDFNGQLESCDVDAYQYDANKTAFVFNKNLSLNLKQEFCDKLSASL